MATTAPLTGNLLDTVRDPVSPGRRTAGRLIIWLATAAFGLLIVLQGLDAAKLIDLGFESPLRAHRGPRSGELGQLPFGGEARFVRGPGEAALAWLTREHRTRLRRDLGLPRLLTPFEEVGAWVVEQVRAVGADLVVMVQIEFAGPVLAGAGCATVMMTHNHESSVAWADLRRATRRTLKSDLFRMWKVLTCERRGFSFSEQVWCVSNADAKRYAGKPVPAGRLFVIPNIVPPSAFRATPPVGTPGVGVFFGHLGYPPNREAVLTILEVSRDLRAKGCDHEFLVLGNGADDAVRAAVAEAPSVTLLGFVDDLMAVLDRAAVVIAPLGFGGGTKLKVLEAMAAGRPVLTTDVGVEGIDGIENDVHAVVRPLGDAFVTQAEDMLRHPAKYHSIGTAGQALVRRDYSMDALDAAVSDAVSRLTNWPYPRSG